MFFKLLLLFTIVPVIELYLLFEIGSRLGSLMTVLIILLTGVLGASLAKAQGVQVIEKINKTAQQGSVPGRELLEGVLVLIGGITLLTPGFFTDFLGLSLIFPPTRRAFARILAAYIKKRIKAGQWQIQFTPPKF